MYKIVSLIEFWDLFILLNILIIHHCIDCVDWFIAGFFLSNMFRINYIDFPYGSGILEPESAYCAMIDENISPKVREKLLSHIQGDKIFIEVVPYPWVVLPDVLPHPDHLPVLLLRADDPDNQESKQQQHPEIRLPGLKQEGRV